MSDMKEQNPYDFYDQFPDWVDWEIEHKGAIEFTIGVIEKINTSEGDI